MKTENIFNIFAKIFCNYIFNYIIQKISIEKIINDR